MMVKMITDPSGRYENIKIDNGIKAEELYLKYREKFKNDAVIAMANNHIVPLDYEVQDGEEIEFLDITNNEAYLSYQSSLTLLLLKASSDLLGDKPGMRVRASINDGLYITYDEKVDEEQVAKIYQRMKKLVEDDIPIISREFTREEGKKLLEEEGLEDKSRLLNKLANDETIKIYSLDGYSEFFYNYLVPSTSYLNNFELMRYRDGILLRYPHPSDPHSIPRFEDDYIVYNAFVEQAEWKSLLGINYMADLNDATLDKEKSRTIIQLSEALHDKKIVQIANRITEEKKRMILILGPSSSGKTTFARRLLIQLMVNGLRPLYIGTDDYFVEREDTPRDENGEYDFESIEAVDIELFNNNMNDLLLGKEVDMPIFDFITGHKKFGKRMTRLESGQPIIVEGIHAFNHALTGEIDDSEKFKIYISPLTQLNLDAHNRIPATDTRIFRRIIRDARTRDHTAEETLKRWSKVHEAESVNIFPYTHEADIFFNSVHLYEMAVIKKYAEPLLKKVKEDSPEYSAASRLLRELRYVSKMTEDNYINNDSILREFIGGGTI